MYKKITTKNRQVKVLAWNGRSINNKTDHSNKRIRFSTSEFDRDHRRNWSVRTPIGGFTLYYLNKNKSNEAKEKRMADENLWG